MSAVSSKFMAALAQFPDKSLTLEAVCRSCVQVLPVDRASIGITGTEPGWEPLAASDATAANLQAQQLLAGDGPVFDTLALGGPVLTDDLSTVFDRWPGFLLALGEGVHGSLFAFPLQVGAISVGVLSLHRADPRPLEGSEVADVVVIADVVTMVLLSRTGPAAGDDLGDDTWWAPSPSSSDVHQATGMVVAQMSVSPDVALLRLRAHAFATGRPLHEVARAVIDRRLRFDPENAN